MINQWFFSKQIVLGEEFLKVTGNRYEFVAQRPYTDAKGKLPNGVILTLRILEDTKDYGIDKKTGVRRLTNRGQNFDATILCDKTELPLEFGDIVALENFDAENSFAVNFDLFLRFKGVKKLSGTGAGGDSNHAQPSR
ncbi:MAG: hypothetical protein J1E06_08665 [Acutalibacter sp.]|nr:hypothetical protein [Acutalibacter sp.]